MYLTSSAYKVGCYLSTGGTTFYPVAKSFFGLGEEDKQPGFLRVGLPKHSDQKSRGNSIAEKVRWEK